MEKKKHLIGIKVISIFFILPLVSSLIMFYITSMSKVMLMLPDSKKIELMQAAQWKKLNITTIEQFDAHMKKTIPANSSKHIWGMFGGIIALFFSMGLWNLKPWSRIGTIIYSCFNISGCILGFLLGATGKMLYSFGQFLSIVTFVIIIYYLNRPNIKKEFMEGKKL